MNKSLSVAAVAAAICTIVAAVAALVIHKDHKQAIDDALSHL